MSRHNNPNRQQGGSQQEAYSEQGRQQGGYGFSRQDHQSDLQRSQQGGNRWGRDESPSGYRDSGSGWRNEFGSPGEQPRYGQDLYGRSAPYDQDRSYGSSGQGRSYEDDRRHGQEQRYGSERRYSQGGGEQDQGSYSRDWDRSFEDRYAGGRGNVGGGYGGRGDSFGTGSLGNRQSQGQGGYGGYGSGQREQSHDPDYQQWRREQMNALDNDYDQWRQDRYQKFSDEFSTWRSGRAASSGSGNQGSSETPPQSSQSSQSGKSGRDNK